MAKGFQCAGRLLKSNWGQVSRVILSQDSRKRLSCELRREKEIYLKLSKGSLAHSADSTSRKEPAFLEEESSLSRYSLESQWRSTRYGPCVEFKMLGFALDFIDEKLTCRRAFVEGSDQCQAISY